MKLKYYLRGLGIGMIVTSLILGISFSNRQENAAQTLTDDQIKERAAELGMVDGSSLTLSALQNTTEPKVTLEPKVMLEPTVTSETMVTPEPTVTPEPETTPEPEATSVPEATMLPEPAVEPDTSGQTEGAPGEKVSIVINKGAGSDSVSRQLQEAGLVEDAKAYDKYLCDNGYSRSISTGTYEITIGTSEEEIAKIITRKH